MATKIPQLTRTQLDYAAHRIHEIAAKKKTAGRIKLGARPKLSGYDADEMMALIRSGKATLKTDGVHIYTDLIQAFDYPIRPGEKAAKAAQDKYDTALTASDNKIDADVEALLDKLHLSGDSAAVLALIEAFAAS